MKVYKRKKAYLRRGRVVHKHRQRYPLRKIRKGMVVNTDIIKKYGWKQKTPKVWEGAIFTDPMFETNEPNKAVIRLKKSSSRRGGFNVKVNTSFGHESGHGNDLPEAEREVEWFMERRPQNVPEAYRRQRPWALLTTPDSLSVQQGDVIVERTKVRKAMNPLAKDFFKKRLSEKSIHYATTDNLLAAAENLHDRGDITDKQIEEVRTRAKALKEKESTSVIMRNKNPPQGLDDVYALDKENDKDIISSLKKKGYEENV